MSYQHKHQYERESSAYYDQIAQKFDRTWDGFLSGFFKRYIVKNLKFKKNMTVLDIGCANGTLLKMLNSKKTIYGTGLDISPEMIKVAQRLHPDFNFFVGNAESLSFSDNSFDIITCSASIHHFSDLSLFLKEAARVLRPDGRLVIAEIRIPIYDIRNLYNHYIKRYSTEGDVKVYSDQELSKIFSENNWKIIKRKSHFQIQYYELQK